MQGVHKFSIRFDCCAKVPYHRTAHVHRPGASVPSVSSDAQIDEPAARHARPAESTADRHGAIVDAEPPHAQRIHSRFERDGEWVIAYCPEIPGANGQGRTKDEARDSLRQAIALILEDRREDGLRAVPADAEREMVVLT